MIEKDFSLKLTLILTKIGFVAVCLLFPFVDFIIRGYDTYRYDTVDRSTDVLVIAAYSVMPMALIMALHKLLKNVLKNEVFTESSVKQLRLISYLCFAVGAVFFALGFSRTFSFMISAAAIFFGLIMRVLKNVFSAAVRLEEENDLTV